MSLPVNMTPDEGMAKSIATKEVIRNQLKLIIREDQKNDNGRPKHLYGSKIT